MGIRCLDSRVVVNGCRSGVVEVGVVDGARSFRVDGGRIKQYGEYDFSQSGMRGIPRDTVVIGIHWGKHKGSVGYKVVCFDRDGFDLVRYDLGSFRDLNYLKGGKR